MEIFFLKSEHKFVSMWYTTHIKLWRNFGMVFNLEHFSEEFYKRNNITYKQLQELLRSMESDKSQNSLKFFSIEDLSIDK